MLAGKPKTTQILALGFLLIVALLPFHALFTTWAISNFGQEVLFKSWKELLILAVLLPASAYILIKQPSIFKTLYSRLINKLIFAYVALNCLLVLVMQNTLKAEAAGLVFNLRFLAMFVLAQILCELLPKQWIKDTTLKIIFVTGLFVVVFGALQVLLLPADFLRHFGYSKEIIPPYFTVDNNESLVRILSTLRGPNALGAYLVFWLPILAVITKKVWQKGRNWQVWAVLVWAASLITLYGTRSRSAWLGVACAAFIYIYMSVNDRLRKILTIATLAVMALAIVVVFIQWNSSFVQTTLLHRDPAESSQVDSDSLRTGSLTNAINDIKEYPLGQGPGAAGLASVYGNTLRITENYFLQVGQELGLLGLGLFIAINALVLKSLWLLRKKSELAVALFAGFIGITLVNLLLPAWADETLSMLWWGMAGVVIYSVAAVSRKKSHSKT